MTSWIYTDSRGYNNEIWLVPPGEVGGPVQAKYHLWWRIKENRIGPWTYDGNFLILSEADSYWNNYTPVVAGVPTMVDCDEEINDGSSPYYAKCGGRSVKRFIMVIKNDNGREWVFKFKAFKKFID
ncbi:MAG: hypothetical protein KJP23_13880 [Deltaproteobacteria bacterium]|nr:hypothetical protein [Deltaproteobacteria bacterium]